MKRPRGGQLQRKVRIGWSSDFAYGIGLITSDGWLSSDQRHTGFVSKDKELIDKIKTALNITNKVHRTGRGGEIEKRYYGIHFGDKIFYQFLNSIGLTSAKSKTIKSVAIPDEFFPDFLRGLFDGDGTIYSYWDTRWPKSFLFQVSFASASPDFIHWLKNRLSTLYRVKGFIKKGSGVLNLNYVKGDSKILLNVMYYKHDLLLLNRKYSKVNKILNTEFKFGLAFLQKPRNYAAIAQSGRAEA